MTKLLLFDVDKTLITNTSEKPFDQPIKNLHGLDVKMGEDFAGLTDQLILAKLLRGQGWDDEQIKTSLPQLIKELERVYAQSFDARTITLLAGVKELLEALSGSHGVIVGLITGNLKSIAKLKLEAVGIYSYFTTGAFGDDPHTTRAELVKIAVKRAGFQDRLADAYVIGDTELDIKASLDGGVANAVGVSNGFKTTQQLLDGGAAVVFQDFSDTRSVLRSFGITTKTPNHEATLLR